MSFTKLDSGLIAFRIDCFSSLQENVTVLNLPSTFSLRLCRISGATVAPWIKQISFISSLSDRFSKMSMESAVTGPWCSFHRSSSFCVLAVFLFLVPPSCLFDILNVYKYWDSIAFTAVTFSEVHYLFFSMLLRSVMIDLQEYDWLVLCSSKSRFELMLIHH